MATCDRETTVFEKDTPSAPKRQDAWECYGSGGYVEFNNVYSNTHGRIKYKLPLGISSKYLNVIKGQTYATHSTSEYKFTLECITVFWGMQSNAIKIKTCIIPLSTPTPTPTPTGSLKVNSSPTGATVRIDGQTWWQTTNCTITNLSSGYHSVQVMKSGYISQTKSVYIPGNMTTTHNVNLVKTTPAPTPSPIPTTKGHISCISMPDDATVRLNHQTWWEKTNCLIKDQPIGNYRVDFLKDGYTPFTKNIYLSAGETEIVSGTLIKLHDEGSIKCTCNVEATVTIDDKDPHTTPHTYTGLPKNAYRTIRFVKTNYQVKSILVLIKGNETCHADLTYIPSFGFDINVNISGLTSYDNKKLWVEPVTKIPFTNTWIPSGVYGGIQWERVINRQYIARDSISTCEPQPNKYFTGSSNKLEKNKDYAIFVGDVILETFPDNLVYRTGTSTPTTVNINEDHYDWFTKKVCGFIGVDLNNCNNWFGALLVDLVSPIADLHVIVNHRSLYTNEPEDPTTLTYFCAALGCIPAGGVIKQAGKLKYTDELAELSALCKKDSKLYNILFSKDVISKIDNLTSNDITQIISAAKRNDITYISNLLNSKSPKLSFTSINNILLNIAEITGDTASYRTMARAMGISDDGFKSLRMIKGASTGQLLLKSGDADDVIHLAGHVPDEFKKVVDGCTDLEIDGMVVKCKQSQHTPLKVAGSMVDDVNLVTKEYKPAPYETVESCIERLGKSAEKAKNYPNGETLYEEMVDGTVHSIKKMEPILDEGMNLNSVDELNKIIYETANNAPSSWRSKASTKFKAILSKTSAWAKSHPKWPLSKGMTLWFFMDNVPFYIYIAMAMLGLSAGSATWQGKSKADNIDKIYWNIKTAEENESWNLFCTNLQMYKQEIDEFEEWTNSKSSTLSLEKMFDTFDDSIKIYRETIKLFEELHSCGLPSSFTATVAQYVDGDSIWLNINGAKTECRLLGINAPDNASYKYSCTGQIEPYLVRRLTSYGKECIEETTWNVDKSMYDSSKHALTQLISINSTVTCYIDTSNEEDKYGRKLVVIKQNGKNINTEMLRLGVAACFFYSYNTQVSANTFLTAEHEAKVNNTGIWRFEKGTGNIRCISSNYTACNIWLDDVDTGEKTVNNEFTLKNIIIGIHTVSFIKTVSGEPYSCDKQVTVSKDGTATAECTLTIGTGPSEFGSIFCESKGKTGCQIWMDGIYTGHATVNQVYLLEEVEIGTHYIEFKKSETAESFYCKTSDVEVTEGAQAFISCTPLSDKKTGSIYCRSGNETACEIWMDGVYTGHKTETKVYLLKDVPIGTKVIKFKKSKNNVDYSCTTTITVYENTQADAYCELKIPITCPKPTASYIHAPSSIEVDQNLHVDASGSSGDTNYPIVTYDWYDNQTYLKSGISVDLKFTTIAHHIVKLIVTNSCGETDTKTKYINVTKPDPASCPNPTSSFVMSPTSPNDGDTVSLNGLDSSGGSGQFISKYEWILNQVKIGTGIYFSFVATQGDHIISLEVTNDCGDTDTKSKSFDVGTTTPLPGPVGSIICKSTGYTGCMVYLDAVYTGHKTESGVYLLKDVPIGYHTIRFDKTDSGIKKSCEVDVFVSEGYQTTAECTISAISPTPSILTGTIYCRSLNETSCEIWLDGVYSGKKTSSNVGLLEDIPIGSHNVVFKKLKSGQQYECSVDVNVLQNQQVKAECWLTKLAIFPITFESYPGGATINKL